jgi:hypothetical protein
VIDTQDSTRTVGGELFATESQRRGLAALLIDGPVSVPSPPRFFRALHTLVAAKPPPLLRGADVVLV